MDIVGTSLSVAQTLLTALQCPQLKHIPEIIGYESQLEELKLTVQAVTSVLRDAERKNNNELLPEPIQFLIEELKDAVFEADDLLDEFVTLADQKRVLKAEGRLSEKISSFFSSSNSVTVAFRMSKGVKKIRKKLDAIVYNKQFNFEHDPEPIRNRNRETCSYVNDVEIIGRKDDLNHIVGMLLEEDDSSSYVQSNADVCFLSIVGIGGLGKTALAKLIFNDHRVKSYFSLRLWTCVADQDQKQLNVTEILRMILASATGRNVDQGSTLGQIQRELHQQLASNKYLLVLDDVWTEDRHQWCELMKYLIGGQRGNRVLVTTRSQKTATIIHGEVYKLQGLSQDSSWHLFEKTAFASDDQPNPPDDLVNIGKKIVGGCAGVPLAIKVARSLVFGQEKNKWLSIQNNGFAHIRDNENAIMPILKLSYYHLASPLKSCFSYCALFPKDYVIRKETLIDLWIAQGYVVPLDYGQSIGDAAEEYFSILLKRCFIQDIRMNHIGEIVSCKVHDLMHDIAQSVSKKEIYALTSSNCANLDNTKFRHLSVAGTRQYEKYPSSRTHIRSLVSVDNLESCSHFPVKALVANFKWLRALVWRSLNNVESLPSSIGELLHLRYLDLSFNRGLELLPKSITKLCNLQTLKLAGCCNLKELPKDLSRLVRVRVLDIRCCDSLAYMPRGMGRLTGLERLEGEYILGGDGNKCSSWTEWFYGLQDLKTLNNLKGNLSIKIRWPEKEKSKNVGNWKEEDCWSWTRESNSCLRGMKHLHNVVLDLRSNVRNNVDGAIMGLLMEELQPHSNLKYLWVEGYKNVKMPGWFTNTTALPNLVNLHLEDFGELEYLPLFFPSLKKIFLGKLEWMETAAAAATATTRCRSNYNYYLVYLN